jgi:lysophospholipase L1-like esterase
VPTTLFYGDSNTWGFQFPNWSRLSIEETWPYLLYTLCMQEGRAIIPVINGLNGRLTAIDDPSWAGRNALTDFPTTLEINDPIDRLVIMLGSNDTKLKLNRSPNEIAAGIKLLIEIVKKLGWSISKNMPKIMIISPPKLTNEKAFDGEFVGAAAKLEALSGLLLQLALDEEVQFFNATHAPLELCIDGVHLNKIGHRQLADLLWMNKRDFFMDQV